MAVVTGTVVAGASATILYRSPDYQTVQILLTTHNNSADVYIGASNVTPTGNGVTVPKSTNLYIDLPGGETLYCAGNGTDTIKFLTFT